MKYDYRKRKRIKPQETILDSEKYMFKEKTITREFEEPEDPNRRIVVNYVRKAQADDGPWALGAGIAATGFFTVFFILLCKSEGNPDLKVTIWGFCGILWAIAAMVFGIRGIMQKDRNHVLSFVGIALGAFQIITWIITTILTSR
ncbi:MAG: hypothetical protein Q4E54_05625 [Lachnospiraceae bacterium]|nr:hypothetical protein [Lachnospiraceae bacterium]